MVINILFKIFVKLKYINNTHVTYSPDLEGVQGTTVRSKSVRVETKHNPISRCSYGHHKFITLTTYVMFVNGVDLLVTLSIKTRLFTTEHILTRTAPHLINYLNKITRLYEQS